MKIISLVCCLTLIIAESFAQPTLTATNINPQTGEKVILRRCNATAISQGASGANVTWDFTSLQLLTPDSFNYKPCSATPYCSLHVASNLALDYQGNEWTYWTANANRLSFDGYSSVVGSSTYSDQMDFLQFPITLGSNYSDSYYGNIDNGQEFIFGNLTIKGDAYGTLKLPQSTHQNALRVFREYVYTDSVVGGTVERKKDRVYEWYVSGIHTPLLLIAFSGTALGVPLDTAVTYYQVLTPNSINTASARNLIHSIYPNPSTGNFRVKLASNNMTAQIIVTDLLGKIIKEVTAINRSEIELDLREHVGLYFVTVASTEGKQTQKISIQ